MEALTQLLATCSLAERTQLVEFAKIKNPPSSKKLMLMELFVKQPGLSDSEYAQKIYKNPESGAYFQLKKRVKDEFEALFILLKPSCIKKETQLHIECSELLLKSQVILARDIRCEGSKLLERSLKMAIKNGFHDLVLTIYNTAIRFGVYEVLNTNDLPELEIAIRSHLQLLIKNTYHKPEDLPHTTNQHLKTMINQLNHKRNSCFILEDINRSIQDGQYTNAWSQLQEAESGLITGSESKTKDELLLAKLSILLAQRDYPKLLGACIDSIDSSDFSLETALRHSLNHWHALFHLNRTDDALQILRKDLAKMDSTQNPRWTYLEAFIDFKQKRFKSALKRIHTCQTDLKSLPDYYLGSKMLELMILFDQNEHDWLEYKIENFRKMIARKKGRVNERIDHAFKLFLKLQKSLLKPELIKLSLDPLLINLQIEKEGLEWIPDTFELVRYDSWICCVLKRQLD
jgi:hypothetical protein